ncbi:MAG: Fe-S protein assembly chaperone HscA [Flavobacteriaceae bacterium]|nr:Fe-S protein assembly chaperone HscA [Flavobacteriaceae bacterium]
MGKIAINIVTGSLKEEELIVGIDLGTTNSLVAFVSKETKHPIALSDGDGQVIVPSIVHIDEQGKVTIGNEAKLHLIEHPGSTVHSVKLLMGKSYADLAGKVIGYKLSKPILSDGVGEGMVMVELGGKLYSPIELSSYILKELKAKAEHYLRQPINKAVITVPAYFNDSQRQATRDAGKLAGLEVLRIVNEPTAASLAYGLGLDKTHDKTIAVYDLGGGTFDISILQITNGVFEVLSTNGDTALGGNDLDIAIVNFWKSKYTIQISDSGKEQEIRLLAEEAKKQLSEKEQAAFSFGEMLLEITKIEFEELAEPIIQKTLVCCKLALKDSGLELAQIQDVVLVGGSTRSPLVKQAVKDFFPQSTTNDHLNPDEVVALGAAVQADILSGNRTDLLLLDVTPLSLGIETLGGLMDTIIPRNNKVPASAAREYTTSQDAQTAIKINMYQGERELVADNRKLGEFELKGIPAMPAGLPKVQVRFILNADGILKVEAEETRSGVKQTVEVKPSYGLSDGQLEQMLLDSITHAQQDVETRLLTEVRTEAEQMIYTTERFIIKHGSLLTKEEVATVKVQVDELKAIKSNPDRKLITASIETLNELTRPFAERVMDLVVAEALKGKAV